MTDNDNVIRIDKNDLKARFEKTKKYVKDHAPEVITAAASVGSLLILNSINSRQRGDLQAKSRYIKSNKAAIDYAVFNGLDYQFFPDLGTLMFHPNPDYPYDQYEVNSAENPAG